MTTVIEHPSVPSPFGSRCPSSLDFSDATQTRFKKFVSTGVAAADVPARGMQRTLSRQQPNWRSVFVKLIQEIYSAGNLEDDEYDPPSRAALVASLEFADHMDELNLAAPSRACLNGEGGVVFEMHLGDQRLVFEYDEFGTGEFIQFRGTRIISRGNLEQ